MRKFTLFLLLLVAMLPLQNVKADNAAFDAFNVSSNVTATWEGNISKVVDGDKTSHWWTSQLQAVDDHITVEFQELQNFGNIVVTFADTDFPTNAAIDISSNGTEWNTVAEFAETDITNHEFICSAKGAQAKYVRLRITAACKRWLKVKEIEVFPYATRTVSATATTGGSVTINGGTAAVESADKITLVATPNTGYQFHYWKVGEEIVSYSYTLEDLSTGDIEYTAVFAEYPALANNKYFIKSIGTGNYLTVKKYNVTDEEGSLKTEAKNGGDDQIFTLEPATEYNKYYIKSNSGYYLNCESWNAYAESEKTTPILIEEIESNIYTMYQTTSSHKAGYLNIQTNHDNGLYCDAEAANDGYKKWNLESSVVVDKSELQELIAEAAEVLENVAGHARAEGDKINIAGKISSNAAQNNADGNSGATNDGAGIAGLTDNNINSYFHSRWGGQAVNEDHYLQIDLGQDLSEFCFSYSVRKGESADQTSPAATKIEVRVSEDGADFGQPIATFTKDGNGLPAYTDLGATLWHSGVISAGKNIRYIRLTVTESQGPRDTQWQGHYFFAMSALNIYSTKLSDEYSYVKEEYQNSITFEQVTAAVNALATAKATNESSAATQAKVNEDADALNAALEALRAASTASHTLNVTAAGWATLYLGFPAEIPTFEGEDAGAYIIEKDGINGSVITLTQVTGVIPAKTGIIVKANEGNYVFNYNADVTADVENNLLKGTLEDKNIEGEAYVLGYAEETTDVVFGKAKTNGTSWLNNANKAYLPASALTSPQSIASYSLHIPGTTGIEEVEVENTVKAIYDLTGRKVNEITAPGIYIVNGKKVLVK